MRRAPRSRPPPKRRVGRNRKPRRSSPGFFCSNRPLGRLTTAGAEGVHAPPGNEVHVAVALPVRQALRETAVERVAGLAVVPPPSSDGLLLQEPGLCRGSFLPLPDRSDLGQKDPEKVRQIRRSQILPKPRLPPCPSPAALVRKPGKPPFSGISQWLRPCHKRLFGLLNRLCSARLAALTDRSAACVFGGLGVTSRDAVRTGGVFLNGGIGGGAGRAVTVA